MQPSVLIAGVDEVGMGPIAGPVVAAAVMFCREIPKDLSMLLDDSKRVKPIIRHQIVDELYRLSFVKIGVAAASVNEIFYLNIRQAAALAMQRAVKRLIPSPNLILVDGNSAPQFNIPVQTIIKGDGLSFSIAAASIVAKVIRDRLMQRLAKRWNSYGWEKNSGYPTVAHRQAVEKHGCSPHHRQGYITIKQLSFKMNMIKNGAAYMPKAI